MRLSEPVHVSWAAAQAGSIKSAWNELHVWRARVDRGSGNQALAARRSRSRSLTVSVLAGYLGCESSSISVQRDASGRPFVEGADFDFNLSHSGDWILLAVIGAGNRVGVDLEKRGMDRSCREIAARYFSEVESRAVNEASDATDIFFRLWTAKEAALKALGCGIARGLADTQPGADEAGRGRVKLRDGSTMNLVHFAVDANHPAAVVWSGAPGKQLRYFNRSD